MSEKPPVKRWGAGLGGLFPTVASIWGLFTQPEQAEFLDVVGTLWSLHSVLAGIASVGLVMTIAAGWPVLRWIVEIPKRRQARRREETRQAYERRAKRERREIKERSESVEAAIDALTRWQVQFEDVGFHYDPGANATRLLLKQRLVVQGLFPESFYDASDDEWFVRAKALLPFVVRYGMEDGGVRSAVARFEEAQKKRRGISLFGESE